MIKLDAGNVLLKPSQRRQLMNWLKRSLRLGQRLGHFILTIHLRRSGRAMEIRADVQASGAIFGCRVRQHEWHDAARELVRQLCHLLHDQQPRKLAV